MKISIKQLVDEERKLVEQERKRLTKEERMVLKKQEARTFEIMKRFNLKYGRKDYV